MGCAGSTESDAGGAGGRMELHSAESLSLLEKKCGGETYEKKINDLKRHLPTSSNLTTAWELSKSNPYQIRWWKEASFANVKTGATAARGDIVLGDTDSLSMLMMSYLPIEAPCANVKSQGSQVVICPVVKAVDLFIKVDGENQTDGHICCGDATNDRAAAIKYAEDKICNSGEEAAVRKMLEDGPPGEKPWATIVSKSFANEHFVLLPLLFQGSLDDANLPESEDYGGALLKRFAELTAKLGPGKKNLELRIAPRGVIAGADEVISGVGGYKGGGTDGIGMGAADYYKEDATFKALVDGELAGQHISAKNPGLIASFSLDLPSKLTEGGGAKRQAPPFRQFFNGDLKEHCAIAMGLAGTGPPRSAVAQVLANVGKPVHIIIPESDLAGGITPMNDQGGREGGTRFFATALFYSNDPSDEQGLGAMVKFVCAKYERRNHENVDNPKWEAEGSRDVWQ